MYYKSFIVSGVSFCGHEIKMSEELFIDKIEETMCFIICILLCIL